MPFRNFFKDNNFLRVWLLIFADRLVQVKKQGFMERSFTYAIGMMDTQHSAFVKTQRTFYSTRMNFNVCK